MQELSHLSNFEKLKSYQHPAKYQHFKLKLPTFDRELPTLRKNKLEVI